MFIVYFRDLIIRGPQTYEAEEPLNKKKIILCWVNRLSNNGYLVLV